MLIFLCIMISLIGLTACAALGYCIYYLAKVKKNNIGEVLNYLIERRMR